MNFKMSYFLILGSIVMGLSSGAFAADMKKPTPALIEKGKAVFTTNCATCHGDKGDGNGPAGQYMNPKPRNFIEAKFKKGGKPEQLFTSVSKGLEGTAMAPFGHLPEEDRWAVVHYIMTFKKK
jgi:mono/diheme cytochrome c family protein